MGQRAQRSRKRLPKGCHRAAKMSYNKEMKVNMDDVIRDSPPQSLKQEPIEPTWLVDEVPTPPSPLEDFSKSEKTDAPVVAVAEPPPVQNVAELMPDPKQNETLLPTEAKETFLPARSPTATLAEESHRLPCLAPEELFAALEPLVLQNDAPGCLEQCRRWKHGVEPGQHTSAAALEAFFAFNESGDTILHCVANMKPLNASAIQSRIDIAKTLVEFGAFLDARNLRNESALRVAVLNAIGVYQESQLPITQPNSEVSGTPVDRNVRLDLVRAFLSLKADVNSFDEDDSTLLMQAAASGDLDLCKLLIEHDADVRLVNRLGLQATDFAEDEHNDVYNMLKYSEGKKPQPEDGPIDISSVKKMSKRPRAPSSSMSVRSSEYGSYPNGEVPRKPVVYYGICDLKYDDRRSEGDQVKVLELGNGFASRFSGSGEQIQKTYLGSYKIANKLDRELLINNKKLTHDVLSDCGFDHLLPEQASFHRIYTPDLHKRIAETLNLDADGEDIVVLKLVNRCRGAGVIVTRTGKDLDQKLHRLLNPPVWEEEAPEFQLDAALALDTDTENCKHWWTNECPIFVAERCESSCPLKKDATETDEFDVTMRIGFVVMSTDEMDRQNFRIEFLGGYWKFPAAPIASTDVRAKCVSKAASMGTASVDPEALEKVYDELRIPLAQVFSVEMKPELKSFGNQYGRAFRSFLKMRGAIARLKKEQQEKDKGKNLHFPTKLTQKMLGSPVHRSNKSDVSAPDMAAQSHVQRQLGCKAAMLGDWIEATQIWRASLRTYSWNATSEHLIGLSHLRNNEFKSAEKHLRMSLAMDPEFKATYANLSAAYLGLEDYGYAERVAQEGLRRYPHTAECSYNFGIAIATTLSNEIGEPIGGRQKQLISRSRKAVRLLQEARDSRLVEKVKTESTCCWETLDDNNLFFLQELSRHLECDGSQEVYSGCESFGCKRSLGWTICNLRP